MDSSAITVGLLVGGNDKSFLIGQNLSFLSALRVFLGLAEAGLYPGIVFYISWQVMWYSETVDLSCRTAGTSGASWARASPSFSPRRR